VTIVSRGRKSAAQLAMIGSHGIETNPRPKPPLDFSKEERAEWKRQVGAMPADYFPAETHPILAQYCRHIVRSRWIASEIARMQNGEIEFSAVKYQMLLKGETSQSTCIKNLAAAMRLTQASVGGNYSRRRANLSKPVWSRQES
jgi:hypothetical protein